VSSWHYFMFSTRMFRRYVQWVQPIFTHTLSNSLTYWYSTSFYSHKILLWKFIWTESVWQLHQKKCLTTTSKDFSNNSCSISELFWCFRWWCVISFKTVTDVNNRI
jgi:hypothetical protein